MAGLREAQRALQGRSSLLPRVALLLGTGLEEMVERLDLEVAIPFAEVPHFQIPHFPVASSAVAGAAAARGRSTDLFFVGRLDGVPVAAIEGGPRSTLPLRVMRMLGAEVLVVTGTCKALDPRMATGDLVVIDDHINLLGDNPLVGPNLDELGPRFPDLTEAYDAVLRDTALREAEKGGVRLWPGIYAAVREPSLGNPQECDWLRRVGADVAGTSIVPEVIVARHMGMRVLGMAAVAHTDGVTGRVAGSVTGPVSHQAEPPVSALIAAVVKEMTRQD